jgi:hypothetical protein
MSSNTTALTRYIAAAAVRQSWTIIRAAERLQVRGERIEAWADRLAVRAGCVDTVLATVTSEARR